MFKLIYALYKTGLFSPSGLYKLFFAIFSYGINIMALLSFTGMAYSSKTALVDDYETLSYKQLLSQSKKLSILLREKYHIEGSQKVAFLCKNHASLVKSIFSISQLGADICLLNAEMSKNQFNRILEHNDFNFLIYDSELSPLVEGSNYSNDKILSYHDTLPSINNLLNTNVNENKKLKRNSLSNIMILTGGTTGNFKTAAHRPSIFNFLNPFLSLLNRLNLWKYNTAYIATPIYHGYGVAVLFLFMSLGKKVVITKGFDGKKACSLIHKHNVQVATVVPLMIYKMLKNNVEELKPLKCIASGGAELNPKLIAEVFHKLGDVLYNLYGTSEAGLNIIATPESLKYSHNTLGKKIKGAKIKIIDGSSNEVETGSIGRLYIKNRWSMRNNNSSWIETGDLCYQDDKGYYFLCGRVDDMVVSAGENVYPIEVEQVLRDHPQVVDAAVIGISDEVFGQRLKAFVLLSMGADITKEELFDWLHVRIARFQMPKDIVLVENMPYTPLGKLDKKQLK